MLFVPEGRRWEGSLWNGEVPSKTQERGLKIGRKKTEYLGCNEHQDVQLHIQGETVEIMMTLKYLGSTLAEEGEQD